MKFEKPENENYCGTIVEIKNIIPFEDCDAIQGTTIFGNSIIIGKDVKIGDVGVYFPAETQLSHEFASNNNLYRHSENNIDSDKKGYLEDNRRIRTMKMRGRKSCGLWLNITSLSSFIDIEVFEIGDTFDKIKNIQICNKYIVRSKQSNGSNKGKKKVEKVSKLVEGQFKFHEDTAQFGKNAHRFKENDIISITYKMHGTSAVISKVLCKKPLNLFYKLLRSLRVKIVDTQYDNIYSSRKVIKNDDMNKIQNHYYDEDVWKLANDKIKEFLLDGMTAYVEIVGFIPSTGAAIQTGVNKSAKKSYPFDYGCKENEFEVYIYRLTYTSPSGHVFEFSAKQVQDWCESRGLKAVPQLYYGRVGDIFEWKDYAYSEYYDSDLSYGDNLINCLREKYLEKDCHMCKNKLPAEGIVIRREAIELEAYKLKSFRFLEMETKLLDQGIEDIEESQNGSEV